jgi:hypothetical protein
MIYRKEFHIVIAEPNPVLKTPYHDLARWGTAHRFETLEAAAQWIISDESPPTQLICVSTSFRLARIVGFLQIIKATFLTDIIPLVLVIDLGQRISFVPGTEWAQQIGILHSLSSVEEVRETLRRITNRKHHRPNQDPMLVEEGLSQGARSSIVSEIFTPSKVIES